MTDQPCGVSFFWGVVTGVVALFLLAAIFGKDTHEYEKRITVLELKVEMMRK